MTTRLFISFYFVSFKHEVICSNQQQFYKQFESYNATNNNLTNLFYRITFFVFCDKKLEIPSKVDKSLLINQQQHFDK